MLSKVIALLSAMLAMLGPGDLSLRVPAAVLVPREIPTTAAWLPQAPAPDRSRPVCVIDQCAPVVEIPGMDQLVPVRGRKTALFISTLDRLGIEPVTSAVRWIANTGIRFDVQPTGEVQVYLRLRLPGL
jgi:hypothetical protein